MPVKSYPKALAAEELLCLRTPRNFALVGRSCVAALEFRMTFDARGGGRMLGLAVAICTANDMPANCYRLALLRASS